VKDPEAASKINNEEWQKFGRVGPLAQFLNLSRRGTKLLPDPGMCAPTSCGRLLLLRESPIATGLLPESRAAR